MRHDAILNVAHNVAQLLTHVGRAVDPLQDLHARTNDTACEQRACLRINSLPLMPSSTGTCFRF